MTKVERSICKSNILFAQAVEQLLLVFGSSAMNSHGSHKQRLCQRIGKSQSRAVREPGGAKVNAARRILDAFRVAAFQRALAGSGWTEGVNVRSGSRKKIRSRTGCLWPGCHSGGRQSCWTAAPVNST